MKFSTAAILAVGVSTVAASWNPLNQKPLGGALEDGDPEKVPGENPLEYCEETDDYILEITNVDLDPNPPKAGETLTIKAKGNVTEKIEKGAYVFIEVKYGLIKILSLKEDLCEQLKNVDKECPLEKESLTLTRDVDLPSRIPPGTYSVKADVYTNDDRKITCLTTKIRFGGD